MIIPISSIVKAWLVGQKKEDVFEALADLKLLADALGRDNLVRQFLLSPKIERAVKVSLLKSAGIHELVLKFINWLDLKLAWSDLPKYIAETEHYVANIDATLSAKVLSAIELSSQEKTTLQKRLTGASGESVRLETQVDPGIIGGLIVDFKGKRYDSSLRGRLNQMNKIVNNLKLA